GLRILELGDREITHQAIPKHQVMPYDENAVARRLHVAFDHVGAFGQGGLERRPAVIRMRGAAAAMRDHLRYRHAGCSFESLRTVDRATRFTGTVSRCDCVESPASRRRIARITADARSSTGCRNGVRWEALPAPWGLC